MSAVPETADAGTVLALLRKLPPRERLRVIATALPETERETTAAEEVLEIRRPKPSLYGSLRHLGPTPSAEAIEESRREAWSTFPRDDV